MGRATTPALLAALAFAIAGCGPHPGASPAQPIAFSHRLHAGDNRIACLFCHGNAARAAAPNLPAARDCYVCHWAIGEGKPEIAKLERYVEDGKPIHWRKVVRLPEHVQFNHAAHVRRGIDCAACHGRVEAMDQTVEVRRLTMGFCIDCHWQNRATDDCVACHH